MYVAAIDGDHNDGGQSRIRLRLMRYGSSGIYPLAPVIAVTWIYAAWKYN